MGWEGENLSGKDTICMTCQKKCSPFLPDNHMVLNMCPQCWNKLSIPQRAFVVSMMRQAEDLTNIACLLRDVVNSKQFFEGRQRKNEGN